MSKQLTQTGTFRGHIVNYGLTESQNKATAICITLQIEDIFDKGEWYDWREYDLEVSGDLWIIKKDGSLNEQQIRAVTQYANWDGNLLSVVNHTWEPSAIQVVVQENIFKENVSYRINWINAYDSIPGGGNITPDKAKELQSRYGSQLRAMVGNVVRNSSPPASKPTLPGKPLGTSSVKPESTPDAIPF
jgi:hypothetical protein